MSWDGQVEDTFVKVFDEPVKLVNYGDLGSLPPAEDHAQSMALAGSGVLVMSDGISWSFLGSTTGSKVLLQELDLSLGQPAEQEIPEIWDIFQNLHFSFEDLLYSTSGDVYQMSIKGTAVYVGPIGGAYKPGDIDEQFSLFKKGSATNDLFASVSNISGLGNATFESSYELTIPLAKGKSYRGCSITEFGIFTSSGNTAEVPVRREPTSGTSGSQVSSSSCTILETNAFVFPGVWEPVRLSKFLPNNPIGSVISSGYLRVYGS